MAGVTANIDVSIQASLTGTADIGTPHINSAAVRSLKFIEGTDAVNKADVMWSDSRTLTASSTENLDLTGTLTGMLGGTVAMAEVVAIYVEAASTNTNSVIIGGAASNGFLGPLGGATHTYALAPGEFVLWSSQAGWPVVAGTGDLLKVANSAAGTSVTYNIIIVGRTVAA
jgi:hypothetical protein